MLVICRILTQTWCKILISLKCCGFCKCYMFGTGHLYSLSVQCTVLYNHQYLLICESFQQNGDVCMRGSPQQLANISMAPILSLEKG